jgi:hypothetical protein
LKEIDHFKKLRDAFLPANLRIWACLLFGIVNKKRKYLKISFLARKP